MGSLSVEVGHLNTARGIRGYIECVDLWLVRPATRSLEAHPALYQKFADPWHKTPITSRITTTGQSWTNAGSLGLPSLTLNFFCFFVYMLAAVVSYGWPALLTVGFSGNPALLLLVLNYHKGCLFESNKLYLLPLVYFNISNATCQPSTLHDIAQNIRINFWWHLAEILKILEYSLYVCM